MSNEGYEQKYVKEAFDTNWIAPLGENVNKFEEELAKYVGSKNAAALSAGTAAIHMALKALGVKKDDIVFCSSLTFSATTNPIIYQNATPVFIDSEQETWNMDPKALEKAFKRIPNNTNLILHSDQGWQYQMKQYQALLKEKGIRQSMSRKGNCLDNSLAENFFGLLKSELFYTKEYETIEELEKDIIEYIDYYNNKRIKGKLKGMSPVQYRVHSQAA